MKIIRTDIRYTIVEKSAWTPFGAWGWLWSIALASSVILLFILLFCIPHDDFGLKGFIEGKTKNEHTTSEPHTGDVQILLSWGDENDLDLSCEDPYGELINFRNKKSSSNGCLDVDMNVSAPFSSSPIENIYWPVGKAPSGRYIVYVTLYRVNSASHSSDYKVTVKYGEKTEVIEGTVADVGNRVEIFSFILNKNENN